MSEKNLLVELFVEELPPKALNKLGEAFSSVLFESLKAQGLSAENSVVTAYASPRRLAVHATQILEVALDKTSTQKLMPVSVGLDANGNATPALIKRLNGMGLDETAVSRLTKQMDGKSEALFLEVTQQGAVLSDGLQKAIEEAIQKLPIPKVMTYQLADGWSSVNFVRPAHSLVALHGENIVAISVLGLTAGNQTQGHRFEAAVSPVILKNADTYAAQLKTEGAVIASFAERRAEIERQLNAAATKQGLTPIEDDALLDEVTALVERPNVLLGQFEQIYLEVPQECLILTMKANQKYFPLLDNDGKLTNKFLIVSNINPADPSAVIGGNERVVRPRLADAKFFFDQDRKKTLESRIGSLNKVVYHNKLGSQGERTQRVCAIAKAIGEQLGGKALADKADFAAKLAKTDLLTDMVGEFPELQGIMGRYYAQHEGWEDDVAFAIEDHYKPRFAGDDLPRNQVGIAVALADKLETLVGLFSIGEKPTGDKDPFALRRQALGIIRMLIESKLPLPFETLIQNVLSEFSNESGNNTSTIQAIKEFCFDRLSVNLRDQGATPQDVDAVLSLDPAMLSEVPQRLAAVSTFSELAEAPALAAANKRISNILKKAEGEVKAEVNANLLQEPAEIALNTALSLVKPEADKLFESGDYTASLSALAALKAPVDDFFDNVMVNADDPALKANRLGLLATLHQAMNRVADLSKLAG
ncbi:MAG: glycine--tRNA ligase subunit beta [Methylotenera sp.]|nr:glycine--tRNA ligase subunit beta [Methylotenera sp.]MDO9234368.1 glycine--tRNA ligase subunit beta [Methylotenera sp.]MDO9388728.1 glycine--tRNA ligase subunit beta [Methylotenera sp.]MDP2101259.1 glycine--tRNA ligase subunit beta [Methylotenera sp.]MDP2280697.1 glycine--tRNA ligase subunit beta [Methylotenera sp.]